MQRRTLTLALVTTLVLGTWSLSAQAVELQQPAPAFTAQDAHGKPISLSDHSGKIVVLPPRAPSASSTAPAPRRTSSSSMRKVAWPTRAASTASPPAASKTSPAPSPT
ncbi:MAG: redoxin domain-containing protein [Burkholderiales bacterium]|nr:redoxin domain-containing protein [Burkholderiales bacterium]MBH2014958.1 redoxin domain-containing protein [Burkholderiales bacterium]